MTDLLLTVGFTIAAVGAALYIAHLDDTRRERGLDDIIAARYRQPIRLGAWHDDDTCSVPTSVRTSLHSAGYGAGVGTDHTEHDAPLATQRVDGRAGSTPHAGTSRGSNGRGVADRDGAEDCRPSALVNSSAVLNNRAAVRG